MTAAVYMITNTVVNRAYVGKSVRVERRIQDHIKGLTGASHIGLTSDLMWEDCRKHGLESFTFQILRTFDSEDYHEMSSFEAEMTMKHKALSCHGGYNQSLSFGRNDDEAFERQLDRERVAKESSDRQKIHGRARHKVIQRELSGDIVREWPSLASLKGTISRQSVYISHNNNRPAKGFLWEIVVL